MIKPGPRATHSNAALLQPDAFDIPSNILKILVSLLLFQLLVLCKIVQDCFSMPLVQSGCGCLCHLLAMVGFGQDNEGNPGQEGGGHLCSKRSSPHCSCGSCSGVELGCSMG